MYCPKCGKPAQPLTDYDIYYCEECNCLYKLKQKYTYLGWQYNVEEIK